MILPIVDPFSQPFEVWTTRNATQEEMIANYRRTGVMYATTNDKLITTVTNGFEAAMYMAQVGADGALGNHVNHALDSDYNYKQWRLAMPRATPQGLKNYKSSYPHYDADQVNKEINEFGHYLSPGQVLFHAGVWPGGTSLVTDRPLSTSFCPQVALRNADHNGKAYEAGRIDLLVIRVAESATKAFAYKRKGMALGHENEVVFAAGASLSWFSETLVRKDYPAGKAFHDSKDVPAYVLEIDLI